MLAEGTVEGEGGLVAPGVGGGGGLAQPIGHFTLTHFGTAGSKGLAVTRAEVVGELVHELETLDGADLHAGGGPEVQRLVEFGVGQQGTQRVHHVTMQTGPVAVLGDVFGIFREGTAENSGIRT